MPRTRPKKVLLLTSNFPRWAGDSTTPFVLNLATDLRAEGWQVDVLAPHAADALRHEVMNGVKVRRFRYLLPVSQQTVAYGGGALINLRESKMNWVKVPFLVLAELMVALRMLGGRRYAIVNAHWILPQGFVAALAGRITGTPIVTTVHGGDVFDLQGSLLGRFKRWALRRARVVTVNSSATEAVTRKLDPTAAISRIPMGAETTPADQDRTAEIRAAHRRSGGPLVVFVGRLVTEKGVGDLIRAMAIVRKTHSEATLMIVGSGQDQPTFAALCAELGLNDSVVFTGWVGPDEVPSYMAAADVFVGPSKTSATGWQEGLGLVFLEAMAAGTAVIATESGGIVDIVRHEETGLLVSEESPEQIAAAIIRLHSDDDLRASLTGNGAELVHEAYTRQASARAFANLFDSVSGVSPG